MDDQYLRLKDPESRALRTLRQSLNPKEEQMQALWNVLAERLQGGTHLDSEVGAKQDDGSSRTSPSPDAPAAKSSIAPGLLTGTKLKGALIVATVSGFLGFFAGRQSVESDWDPVVRDTPKAPQEGTVPEAMQTAPRAELPGDSRSASPSADKSRSGVDTGPTAQQAGTVPSAPDEPLATETTLGVEAKGTSTKQRARGQVSVEPERVPMTLYNELRYVQRAQAALASGHPELALGLMQTLDESGSSGALLAERRMSQVLALCALERTAEALSVARTVVSDPGGAPYLTRLEASCAGAALAKPKGESLGEQTSKPRSDESKARTSDGTRAR